MTKQPFWRRSGSQLLVGMGVLLGLLLIPSVALAGSDGPTVEWRFSFPSSGHSITPAIPQPQDATVFYDDLKVSGGESYDGDVVVYNGDVDVEGGGRIAGNLYVYSGDVDVKGGGQVSGDVIAYGGDVQIHGSGQVGGDVQALGGDVRLQDGSSVGGDVSVLGGDIDRGAGASVGGNVLSGPNIAIPDFPILPGAPAIELPGFNQVVPTRPEISGSRVERGGFGGWLLDFVMNLFKAALFTLLAVIGAGLVVVSRPAIVGSSLTFLDEDPRSSLGIGLLANMVVMIPLWMWLGSLSASFFVALCLSPLLLPLGLIALVIELAGLAVGGRWLGDRLADVTGFKWEPLAATAVGVTLIVGMTGFLWALSNCLGWLALIWMGAPGVGALILYWREGRPNGPMAKREIVQSAAPAPVEAPAPPTDLPDAAHAPVDAPDADMFEEILGDGEDLALEDFDFTQLSGIGPVFSMRLKAANVRTLGDLAGMSPESLADVLNLSAQRVIRDDVLGQARRLLGLE